MNDAGFPTLRRKDRPKSRRIAMVVSYDGSGFHGFQRQPDRRTVEGDIVIALKSMGLSGGLGFSSRTDAGVHANGQVIAFAAPDSITIEDVSARMSEALPPDIHIRKAALAPAGFHPRWSALGKDCVYRLPSEFPQGGTFLSRLRIAMDSLKLCPSLTGFSGVRSTSVAPGLSSLVLDDSSGLAIRFQGPGFRRYAIRHMVACLVDEAIGQRDAGFCATVAAQPPPYRGSRASPGGLTLEAVFFPPEVDPFV